MQALLLCNLYWTLYVACDVVTAHASEWRRIVSASACQERRSERKNRCEWSGVFLSQQQQQKKSCWIDLAGPPAQFPGSLHTNEVRRRAFRTAAPFRAVFYPQSVAWTVTSTMGTRSDCGIDAVRKRRFLRSTCVWMDMRRKQRASVGVCWHFSLSSRAGTDQCSHYLGCTVGAAACLLCCCVWSIEEVYGHATGQVGNV